MQYVSAYCNGSRDSAQKYLTLSDRVDNSVPLFPMPNNKAEKDTLTEKFIQDQCKYLFDEYSGTMSEYIIQCISTYNNILCLPGDISAEIINFVQCIKKDIAELFDESVAQQAQNEIVKEIQALLKSDLNRELLTDKCKRACTADISFENIFKNAFLYIAESIKLYVDGINKAPKDQQMKLLSEYVAKKDVVPFVVCLKLRRNIYGVVTDIRDNDGRKEIEFETWFANKKTN